MKRIVASIIGITLFSCGNEAKKVENNEAQEEYSMSFTQLSSSETGISFSNNITETDSFNYFNYEYMYIGGGTAIGDVNNDGLEDIYFTGNQVSDKLYINKGNMKFEDVTDKAIGSLASEGWHTGVLMQDVNQDGWLDIYVSRSGPMFYKEKMSNLLFVNKGDGTFSEESEKYGVAGNHTTIQSVFFDLDNDGDQDLYMMNHPYQKKHTGEQAKSVYEINKLIESGSPYSDVLLENVDGKYVDITKSSGVTNYAFGLGVVAADVNGDGFTDLHVSNDFMAADYLYINNGDKTFTDESQNQFQHMSNYAMGNDIADFNNDGLLDIISVDMVSEHHVRSKKNMGGMNTEKFWEVVASGHHYQYMFNSLQMNNGNGTFSEIGQLAGISKTDWSWAPLFADFNNDGLKDLFITNGLRRDTRDNDYSNGLNPSNKKIETFEEALNLMPKTKVENYMFKNNGDLTFTKVNSEWNTDQLVNSNGAAYADLDNDGDLDMIVNNMDEESFIMRNDLTGNSFVNFSFVEPASEGVVIKLKVDTITQTQEFRTVRGYQSSVSHVVHFGLGADPRNIEATIIWPDKSVQYIKELEPGSKLRISKADATHQKSEIKNETYFELNNGQKIFHKEIFVNDFKKEVLLPHKMSQLGPFMSKSDVNADGKEDFYLSGSRGFSGQLMIADGNSYVKVPGPWESQVKREELGSVFFDVDNDGDQDLYVVSGSNEYNFDSPMMQDQLYINNGNNSFSNASDQLPKMVTSGQKVIAGDYDNDGDQDLFIGGRQTPGYYPFAPRSYLLENVDGKLIDVTERTIALMGPGMITDAEFIDLDSDKDLDLVVVGEWMAPSFYRNDDGTFVDISSQYGTQNEVGWWTSVTIGDFNNDQKPDFVFGNIGLNNKFHPSKQHPLEIYTADFDKNGTYDIVLGEYENGTCYPVRGKQCSSEQMPFVSQKFPTYGEFAVADLEKIYGEKSLEDALHFSATEFRSIVLMSAEGKYDIQPLNNYAQMGPLNAIVVLDINGDNHLDILGCGNNFAAEVETIRYDGGRGVCLLGDGAGNFKNVFPTESGFFVNADAKDMKILNDLVVVTSNNNCLLFFKQKTP